MLWISLCVARVRKDCTSHCGMCPSGFRQAIRGKRSGTLNPPCEMPGRQLALLWVCLWKSCSHSPLKKCLRRSGERHWTEPQDFSRLAKEPGKRCCGMRHDGASRNCGQRIHPWRRRACFRRSPRTFLESRKTQYSWASWRLKGKSWRHFHGHSRSAGFLWKSCWQTVPEAGRRGCPRDSADPWLGRERSSCRAPPNGCRYLVDKAVGKVLEKMPCQVAPMACRVGCFLSIANVAKIAGTIGAGGFPRSRMDSRHAVDNSVSKVVMTVLRQMLTRVRRRVARKCAAASQACPGLVPLGAGAWPVAPGASRVPGLS